MILPLLIYILVIIFFLRISKWKILYNDVFWLVSSWGLLFIVYYSSGMNTIRTTSFGTICYIILCFFAFFVFRYFGAHSKVVVSETKIVTNSTLRLYTTLGVIGLVLYVFDFLRLNGGRVFIKSTYQISLIGTVGSLLVPMLFVCGLYEFYIVYSERQKVSIKSVFLLAGYLIPCILNSGRESVLYLMIAVLASFSYARDLIKIERKPRSLKQKITILLIIVAVGSLGYIILNISMQRFGMNEVNTFLYRYNLPQKIMDEANSFGNFRNLYINIISYLSHQLPFLDFVVSSYKGPYMGGLYELNIISRRLPASFGLDYRLVLSAIPSEYLRGWPTIIGVLIFDFGQILCPVVIACLGFLCGRLRKKLKITNDPKYVVLTSFVCFYMFSTLQLGPFFNPLVYGLLIWSYLLFHSASFTHGGKQR